MNSVLLSYNPHNQSVVGETPQSTSKEVENAVSKAKKAFLTWKKTPIPKRAEYFKSLRSLLVDHKEELATLTTKEMGKPIKQSRDDVDSELGFIDWYIENAEEALSYQAIKETDQAVYEMVYEPWGVCVSIAPWNFPISMASSGISQQVLAGNCVIFKPSEYTTLTQKRFIELLQESGIPDGVVQGVYGDGEVGKMLVDSDIDLIWFTGSTAVGQEIYAKAGRKFIKAVMEMGGSSPGIVFADADLNKTLEQLYWARFLCNGQICSAVKRLFVEKSIFRTAIDQLKARLAKSTIGDPLTEVDFGPLVSKEQLDTLISQVEEAKQKGVTVEIGGKQPDGKEFEKGNYYLPTILTNVTRDMRVYREETFGPVLVIMPFEEEAEAIKLANDTPYGLSAEVYTSDPVKADRVAKQLQSGMVGINTDSLYWPWCPIGGYKKSGMGREYGIEGFRELTQIKYICVAK